MAGKLEEKGRGPGAFAIALGGVGKAKDPPGARDADIGDPALFLDIVRIGVRQNPILHAGQKHGVPFEPFGGMDGRKHNGMPGGIAQRFGLLLDLCVQFLQGGAGEREPDHRIDKAQPLRLFAARGLFRQRVACDALNMPAGSGEIAPHGRSDEIELFAHNVAALAAAQARHGGGAVAVAKIMESADDKLGCAALPDVARAAHFEGDRQFLERRLEREPNGAGPVKHGRLPRRIALGEKRGYRPRRLPRLDLGARIAADDDLSRFADGWRIVLVAAGLVMTDQPLGGLDDLTARSGSCG